MGSSLSSRSDSKSLRHAATGGLTQIGLALEACGIVSRPQEIQLVGKADVFLHSLPGRTLFATILPRDFVFGLRFDPLEAALGAVGLLFSMGWSPWRLS